jgi:hypothetical protein
VLLILTTPLGQDNETTRLFNTKFEGKPIIRAVRIGRSCDQCREARVLCNHVENATAEGLSKRKRQAFMKFYENQMHVAMREYTGETSDDSQEIFKKEWVTRLLQKKPFKTPAVVDFIFASIDPAQGGACEWGFCACYYDVITNTQVIVQIDGQHVEDVGPNELTEWLRASINHIRSRSPAFATIPIVIACEAAPVLFSRQLEKLIIMLIQERSVYNVHVMRESSKDSPGVIKTKNNTQHMVSCSAQLLQNNQVSFADVFGSSIGGISEEIALREKTKFLQQLVNVKVRYVPSSRQDGGLKYRIDGKAGGMNDDVAVAWFMNYYWYLQFVNSPKDDYIAIRNQTLTVSDGYVKIISKYHTDRVKRARQLLYDEHPRLQPAVDIEEQQYFDFSDTTPRTHEETRARIDRIRTGARDDDIVV